MRRITTSAALAVLAVAALWWTGPPAATKEGVSSSVSASGLKIKKGKDVKEPPGIAKGHDKGDRPGDGTDAGSGNGNGNGGRPGDGFAPDPDPVASPSPTPSPRPSPRPTHPIPGSGGGSGGEGSGGGDDGDGGSGGGSHQGGGGSGSDGGSGGGSGAGNGDSGGSSSQNDADASPQRSSRPATPAEDQVLGVTVERDEPAADKAPQQGDDAGNGRDEAPEEIAVDDGVVDDLFDMSAEDPEAGLERAADADTNPVETGGLILLLGAGLVVLAILWALRLSNR